jgi:hypothetical protein
MYAQKDAYRKTAEHADELVEKFADLTSLNLAVVAALQAYGPAALTTSTQSSFSPNHMDVPVSSESAGTVSSPGRIKKNSDGLADSIHELRKFVIPTMFERDNPDGDHTYRRRRKVQEDFSSPLAQST